VNPDDTSVGTKQGAMYESGLDNSPMFDAAAFDAATGRLLQADAGLMGLYVADCDALAEIAGILGRTKERDELTARATRYRERLRTLWDDAAGIFVNRDLKTGAASPRLSPTNFYPLLARAATPPQAERMIREQLLNPEHFGGHWVLPSISRSDPAFKDQEYWRGRVWGPMNYLVYLGLQNYAAPGARRELADKSRALFELEWREHGHVHENYNAITGSGDDVTSSDRFYHWGALLALISLMEERQAPPVLLQKPAVGSR
jgi:neutral trehalase